MWRNNCDSDVSIPDTEGKRPRCESSYERQCRGGSGWSVGSDQRRYEEVHSPSEEEIWLSEDVSNEVLLGGKGTEGHPCESDIPIISGCDLQEFERVVARIPNYRIVEIEEMGFGPVHIVRGIKLNVELCKMLLSNFDVKNSTVKIHGRNLSINAKDVKRMMGLRCRGTEVDMNCSSDDEVLSDLKRRMCGDDTDISLKKLRGMVLSTYDDEELWKVCFALYALATVFCPSRPGYVDRRLMVPLKNPGLIRTHNWAGFVFSKLVEGVSAYQSGEPIHVGGCLIFLQLFYLSVLGERTLVIPTICLPVLSWGQNECERMY
ncbi:uncharacterized protein LOC126783503 [Argentina anserina]|uniref:uncharacterized protein LOC126783503 n=1 Tax=Argentina anserina TaxID=57926 RepID=UPI0021768B3A|nr:uncharacterized protein LOC126783503 [Potentilla anserina]